MKEIPTKRAQSQPAIPLEVLLQEPDNLLLDIPVDDDDEDLPDVQIDFKKMRRISAGLKEKKHFFIKN